MTAACGGGTSSYRDQQFPRYIDETVGAISGLLNRYSALWIIPLAAYIGGISYDLLTFCSTDPPALPTLTPQDALDLANLTAGPAHFDAQQKFQDYIGALLWPIVCQCDSGQVVTPPAIGTEPTDWPTQNPPGTGTGTGASNDACSTTSISYPFPANASSSLGPLEPIPTGATYAQIDVNWPRTGGWSGSEGVSATLFFYTSTGSFISVIQPTSMGESATVDISHQEGSVPSTATQWRLGMSSFNSGGSPPDPAQSAFDLPALLTWYCGNTPTTTGGTQQTCCTDPQVLQLLSQIIQQLTLVGAPTQAFGSLLVGPVTSGLSGAGTLAATGAIGVRIDLTAIPNALGRVTGNPTQIFDAGYLTPLTTQGPTESQRVRYATQVFFFPPTVQSFEYFFASGVTATATLLDGAP